MCCRDFVNNIGNGILVPSQGSKQVFIRYLNLKETVLSGFYRVFT